MQVFAWKCASAYSSMWLNKSIIHPSITVLSLQLIQHSAYHACVADTLAFLLLFELLAWPCLWLCTLPTFLFFVWLSLKHGELFLSLASFEGFFLSAGRLIKRRIQFGYLMKPWQQTSPQPLKKMHFFKCQVQVAKAQDKACLDLLNTCMYTYNNIMYKDLGACVTWSHQSSCKVCSWGAGMYSALVYTIYSTSAEAI